LADFYIVVDKEYLTNRHATFRQLSTGLYYGE